MDAQRILLKRRNIRVAVAFRHLTYIGRMIGHAQKPRYVVLVPTFFLLHSHCLGTAATLFWATAFTVTFNPPPSLLLPSLIHPRFTTYFHIPLLSCWHDPYIHYRNITSNFLHITNAFHWLEYRLNTH